MSNRAEPWKNIFMIGFFIVLLTPQLFETIGYSAVYALYGAVVVYGVYKRVRIPVSAWFGFAYFAIVIAYAVAGRSTAAWGNYAKLLVFYTFPFVADIFFRDLNVKANPWMVTALLLACAYNAAYNFVLNVAVTEISVRINAVSDFAYLHPGGTLFAFQLLLLLMVLLPFFRNSRHRALMLGTMLVSAACLLIFQRAIFLFAMVAFLFLYWVFGKKSSRAAVLIKSACIVLGITVIFVFLDKILLWVIGIMPDNRLRIRVAGSLQYLTSGVDDTNSFSNRWNLYVAAFRTFTGSISNFLFGVGYHLDNVTYEYLLTAGGTGHSELLDAAARFGVLGLTCVAGFFISLHREMVARYRAAVCRRLDAGMIIHLWFLILLLCALLNGIEYFGAMVVLTVLSRLVLEEITGEADPAPRLRENRGIR